MKHEGFTLVELLIVIVVIGILSTMIMMSSTEAVTSSRASNIVSNLRNIKAAALALYSDSIDTFIAEPEHEIDLSKDIVQYLQSGTNMPDVAKFSVKNLKGSWYVFYDVGDDDAVDRARLAQKLQGRAQSAGLLDYNGKLEDSESTTNITVDEKKYYSGSKYVVMKIR